MVACAVTATSQGGMLCIELAWRYFTLAADLLRWMAPTNCRRGSQKAEEPAALRTPAVKDVSSMYSDWQDKTTRLRSGICVSGR